MSTPHILFVDDYPELLVGGGEHHLLRLARGCREWGYRVGVVCAAQSGLERMAREDGFEVWPVRMGRLHPSSSRRLARLFRQAAPDIVHAHGFHATLAACPAAKGARVRSVLATVHSMPSAPLDLRPGVLGRLEFAIRSSLYRRVARHVDRFICVVDAARSDLIRMGLDAGSITVISNGIPNPAVDVVRAERPDTAQVLIGSVGRLESAKGYEYLVDAADIALQSSGADMRFQLVGDGSTREALRSQAAMLGLGGSFEFSGWSAEPLSSIARMDIYVCPSITETTNLTVLEAMSLGLPVIATRVGGLPEAVLDGETGYIVPSRRSDLLARRIVELVGDPEKRAAMGEAGRRRFESRFTLECMLAGHRELYRMQLSG
ncbi:MAG: glycosyltransferase [Coriobacteriia bacterium]|nr:glycosyltransferase [Coriobacteriia bacterium]